MNWAKGYERIEAKKRNSLESFSFYMPLTPGKIGFISVPTPAKIRMGNRKISVKLIFGAKKNSLAGTMFGIGVEMKGPRQLVRMDYHAWNSGHGGVDGQQQQELAVWRDDPYHYHTMRWDK